MKIIGTGITGLVGSRIVELLSGEDYEFVNLNLETGIDITKPETFEEKFKDKRVSWVIHLAAKADVDGCERDRHEDMKIWGDEIIKQFNNLAIEEIVKRAGKYYGLNTAWALNVVGTLNITQLCHKYNKKLIYISTDFVFDGKKDFKSKYSEDDIPNPINFYAQTKYLGEKIVQKILKDYLICRISYPYRAQFTNKKDFVRGIISRLKEKQPVFGVHDQLITPTFIDDIVDALQCLIEKNSSGIYHLTGSDSLSPLLAVKLIGEIFNLDTTTVKTTVLKSFYEKRADRSFNLSMANDKIISLGARMKTFKEGLEKMKEQLSRDKN